VVVFYICSWILLVEGLSSLLFSHSNHIYIIICVVSRTYAFTFGIAIFSGRAKLCLRQRCISKERAC
jgi:hypothetical protein